jgi:ubiquitin conjugation factor E4 B
VSERRYCEAQQPADSILRLEPPVSNPLTPHLLVDPEDDRGLCHEFFSEAMSRFTEDETVKEALVGAIEELSRQLAK